MMMMMRSRGGPGGGWLLRGDVRRFMTSERARTTALQRVGGGVYTRLAGGAQYRIKLMQRRGTANHSLNDRVISKSDRRVAFWLIGCAGMVGSMVAIGGLTRLTVSGLSMVDWKPQGSLPPITHAQWVEEFERYKTFPQWQRSERDMTLSEFKYIFFWEWGHRMLGRMTGLAFAIPLGYFTATRQIPRWLWPRLLGMFALGGTQGLIGWWMVKSGLHEDTLVHKHQVARVSPYRLATHLTMAFGLYSMLTWTAMDLLRPFPSLALADVARTGPLRCLHRLRMMSLGSAGLVITTVVAGAFVAGNDAGRAYNTFPLMNGEVFPSEAWDIDPWWRNIFENTALVQFNHRTLGMTTGAAIFSTLLYARSPAVWPLLSGASRVAVGAFAGLAACQISLGVTALLYYVPIEVGSAHQIGALSLWTVALGLAHTLRPARSRLVNRIARAKPSFA